MPVFILPQSYTMITQELTGIMLFPNSVADRRKLAMSYAYDFSKPYIDAGIAKVADPKRFERYARMHKSAPEIIEQAAKETGYDPTLAGAILLLTVGTDRKVASVNLTILSLDQAYKNNKATSRRKLEGLWQKYRTVAHFWTAHQVWVAPEVMPDMKRLPGFPCHPTQVMQFLALAEYFRRKGEGFRSPHSKEGSCLLDKNRTWRVRPASRVQRMTDADFCFDSMYKFLIPILHKRKKLGKITGRNFAEEKI